MSFSYDTIYFQITRINQLISRIFVYNFYFFQWSYCWLILWYWDTVTTWVRLVNVLFLSRNWVIFLLHGLSFCRPRQACCGDCAGGCSTYTLHRHHQSIHQSHHPSSQCGCFSDSSPVAMPTIDVTQIPYDLLLATNFAFAFQIIASIIHAGPKKYLAMDKN